MSEDTKEIHNSSVLWGRRIVAGVLAYIFLLSLNQVFTLWGEGYAAYGVDLFGYNIWAIGFYVFAVCLIYRMLHRNNRRLHFVAGGIGLLLSMAIVYGSYAHFENNIFQSGKVALQQLGMVLGFGAVTIPLSEEFLLLLDRLPGWCERKEKEEKEWALDIFFRSKPKVYFLAAWVLIFLFYIPIFLGWWPGNFVYDAPFQLNEVIFDSYKTHHPLLHTLLMGWAYKLGQSWGDVSSGYQFYTLLQMLVLSASFAYLASYLYKKRVPRCIRVGVFVWFGVLPLHAIFSISATKDTLFAAFLLFFIVFWVRLLYDCENFAWYSYAGLIISGVLCLLMRNNAIHAILAGGLIVIIFEGRGWKVKGRWLLLLASIFLIGNIANAGLVAATNARNTDSYQESLSVPLQGLARVACYRRDDLEDSLYKEICMYIPEEDIACYNPYLSDEVKYRANEELLRENFMNFVKLWIKVGIQFPDEYIESIVTNTMGYWYPLDMGNYVLKPMEFYHKSIWVSDEIEKKALSTVANKFYSDLFWSGKYLETPILGYLFRLDGWIWCFNFFIAWCIYKKDRRAGLMGAVPFMYIGTCFLGPVAILRYIYCIIVIMPVFLYMILRHRDETGEIINS